MRLVFDTEFDDLPDVAKTVHCICAINLDTGEEYGFRPEQLSDGLHLLDQATTLAGHNILTADLPVLSRILNWKPKAAVKIRDTLVWARLCHSDLEREDLDSEREEVRKLLGGNALADWGIRLGLHKNDYKGGFAEFNEEMFLYCQQDVRVNKTLIAHLVQMDAPDEALDLEQDFAVVSEGLTQWGFRFDTEGALRLCEELEAKQKEITGVIQSIFPTRLEPMKKPAHWTATWPDGVIETFLTKGLAQDRRKVLKFKPKECKLEAGPVRVKEHPFNPGSRHQIRAALYERYGWISPKLTDKGIELLRTEGEAGYNDLARDYGQVTEEILRLVEHPEAVPLADYLLIGKRISQIRDGKQGWLKRVENDRIHHTMIGIGCATMRAAHMSPNLGQVPSTRVSKETKQPLLGLAGRYGHECRSLFLASAGYVMVGSDLSSIEARMLAHFLAPYDGGNYVEQVLHGDIHQLNVDAFQEYAQYTVTRGDSKNIYYAWCYGAGNQKLGLMAVECSTEAKEEFMRVLTWARSRMTEMKAHVNAYKYVGNKIRQSFEQGVRGLSELIEAVKSRASRGYLCPLDGRRIPVRSEHAALNTLLQGSAAIVMKRWVKMTVDVVRYNRLDAHPLAIIHDELQSDVRPDHVGDYKRVCLGSIEEAGRFYRLNLPLVGESKSGSNWGDTH